ncbi:MAG: cupredoxin domain-containing protein [Patescibacteria group bacterium]
MKKTYFTIIFMVLLVLGFLFIGKSSKVEAPADVNDSVATQQFSFTAPEENTEAVKEFTVTGKNFSFSPSLITVKKGDRVKIIFENSAGFHDFKIDEYGVAAKQAQSPATEILEFTANKTGSFEYYCSVGKHRAMGMKGIFIVN